MSDLNSYLAQKRAALGNRVARIDSGELHEQQLKAHVSVEGRSGIRRIRIRDFQVLTDSPPDFAGYDLGPSSPELQLGVLGSCLAHSYLIQAAALSVPVNSIDVILEGVLDARASRPGNEDRPVHPHRLIFEVRISSSATAAQVAEVEARVEQFCPILNLLRKPQQITGSISHVGVPASASGDAAANSAAA